MKGKQSNQVITQSKTQMPTLTEVAMAENFRKRKARITILRWCCSLSAIVIILWGLSPLGQFAIQGTDSVEGTLFFLLKNKEVKRGDIAAFYPPDNQYYKNTRWFGKYVAGMPGDVVTVYGREFYINGQYMGHAQEQSKTGEVLSMSEPGRIPDEYYFMWTPHERSYDSRYADIDLIHKSNIVGAMYKIF